MGGECKLLRPFRGSPLIRWAAQGLHNAGLTPIVVVLGPHPDPIRRALAGLPIDFVENERYLEGMGTSLAAGIAALPTGTSIAVVALGDMPLLSPGVINQLVEDLAGSTKTIAVPVYQGRRGHPVAFHLARHRRSLLSLSGDQGARALLSAHPGDVLELTVCDRGVLLDDGPMA